MITQLEIKNFRGFSEYKIDDIGQVNLLVGTNNCGKTSVLEAIHLLKARDTSEVFSILEERGEYFEHRDNDIPVRCGDLCRLFYGFKMMQKSYFHISSFNKYDQIGLDLAASVENHSSFENKLKKYSSFKEYGHDLVFSIKWSSRGDEKSIVYPINKEGKIISTPERILSRGYVDFLKRENIDYVEYISTNSISTSRIINLFDNIVLTKDEELMLDAIKIIDPYITRLARSGDQYNKDYVRSGFFVKSSKWEERVPIGSFGDGIWRLLGLILSLVGAKSGTLLIDEIDTGLHHSVMSKMWKLICTTAKKLNVQVFATTHSRDCWETLAENAVEDEFADMPIRIHRIDKDRKQAETFTNKEINLALNRELEVR
ncbi:AAA family ATPase [Desulfobulbus sp. F3]|nr:AAA family ATPase [Desulfobulbus sp. F3]